MNRKRTQVWRILAVFPSTRGFGFAVFEGPQELIDWGVKCAPRKQNAEHRVKLHALLEWYRPDVLILEDFTGDGSRKSPRVRRVIRSMARVANKRKIALASFSRSMIRQAFSEADAFTKHEIAKAIAGNLPELAPHLPPKRKLWMSEDYRMSIFDAASLALTFFHFEGQGARDR